MIFHPDSDCYYCVHCLALGLSFASAADIFSHLVSTHGQERHREGRDWISGARALEILAERGHSENARLDWFALCLAACFGVDDLLAAPPRRRFC